MIWVNGMWIPIFQSWTLSQNDLKVHFLKLLFFPCSCYMGCYYPIEQDFLYRIQLIFCSAIFHFFLSHSIYLYMYVLLFIKTVFRYLNNSSSDEKSTIMGGATVKLCPRTKSEHGPREQKIIFAPWHKIFLKFCPRSNGAKFNKSILLHCSGDKIWRLFGFSPCFY